MGNENVIYIKIDNDIVYEKEFCKQNGEKNTCKNTKPSELKLELGR